MGLMRTAAVRGIIPARNKAKELLEHIVRVTTKTAQVLEDRFGEEGLQAASEIFRQLGEEDAQKMKQRLGLGDRLMDALDAWLVLGHLMGLKIEVFWIDENRVETDHSFCSQHSAFVEGGKIYCENVCWPYVEAIAKGVADGVSMDIVRAADVNNACRKAIVINE